MLPRLYSVVYSGTLTLLLVSSVRDSELVRESVGPWNRTRGSRGLFFGG